MDMIDWIRHFGSALIGSRCCLCNLPCQQLHSPICQHCYESLPMWHSGCPMCGMPLLSETDLLCGDCQQHPKPYEKVQLLGWYQDGLQELITRFKYHHDLRAGRALCHSWLSYVSLSQLPDCLIPVPIHQHKLSKRGYNQAAIIAHEIGQRLKIPVSNNLCYRVSEGQSHVSQTRKQRLQQVKNLYQSRYCPYPHVAIIDDVVTTQATIMTLANQLLQQGAKKIEVWALARTP